MANVRNPTALSKDYWLGVMSGLWSIMNAQQAAAQLSGPVVMTQWCYKRITVSCCYARYDWIGSMVGHNSLLCMRLKWEKRHRKTRLTQWQWSTITFTIAARLFMSPAFFGCKWSKSRLLEGLEKKDIFNNRCKLAKYYGRCRFKNSWIPQPLLYPFKATDKVVLADRL